MNDNEKLDYLTGLFGGLNFDQLDIPKRFQVLVLPTGYAKRTITALCPHVFDPVTVWLFDGTCVSDGTEQNCAGLIY